MVFYSLLLVASVIIALVVLYLFHQLADVGNALYRALLPSAKNNRTRHINQRRVNQRRVRATINDTATPWGWQGNDHKIREHGPRRTVQGAAQETAQKAAMGLDAFLNKHENGSESDTESRKQVGWPYREEELGSADKVYKVKRKTRPARTNLKTTGKPWGW